MNPSSSDPAKYQHNSPKQLNTRPRVSVLLIRALGLVISMMEPAISSVAPLVGFTGSPLFRICSKTFRSASSRVAAQNKLLGMRLIEILALNTDKLILQLA